MRAKRHRANGDGSHPAVGTSAPALGFPLHQNREEA